MSTTTATPPQSHSFAAGLERIASAHSSLTSGSSRSDAAGSNNAYSSTSAGTDLMTPVHHADLDDLGPEEELTDHEMEDMYAEAESARQRLAAIGTRSMQDMKKGKGRERSMTDTKPRPASVILAPPVPSHPPTSIQKPSQPIPTPKAAKSSGSFSSFLRRLTGKAPKNKDKNIPTSRPPPSLATTPPKSTAPSTRPQVARQDTAPAAIPPVPRGTTVRQNSMPARPLLHQIDTRDPVRGPQPLSAPSRPPPRAPSAPKEVDPINIPLPPSPTLSPILSSDVPDLIDFSSPVEPTERLSQRRKQSPMLSLEGFGFEEETDEEADEVRPLARPLRITVGSSHRSISPESAPLKSASSAETTIRTPASAVVPNYFPGAGNGSGSESSPEKGGVRVAGSTPPRKAPIGSGPALDRKESKWRKSVMGISDNVTRKQTTRLPPPSSHDAYMVQQRRMANNRMSCQPTLHNNASIAAGVTSYKSKEEQDMAETFFLA